MSHEDMLHDEVKAVKVLLEVSAIQRRGGAAQLMSAEN
jgi:hypothetical protein